MHSHIPRKTSLPAWLGSAALIFSILACTANVSGGGDGSSGPAGSGSGADEPSGPGDSPAGAFFELSDPAGDCYSGVSRALSDCTGLDLTGLLIGLPTDLPALSDEPSMAGRLGFVLTFAGDLAEVESFGLCLDMDLDQNPGTGMDLSGGWGGIPGVDRGVCLTLPEGKTYFYYYKASWDMLVDRAEPNYDDTLASSVVSGNQVGVGIAPSLLGYSAGSSPHGFVLFVGTARSVDPLDNLNDQGTLSQSQPINVPDEVVTQLQP